LHLLCDAPAAGEISWHLPNPGLRIEQLGLSESDLALLDPQSLILNP